MNDHPVHRDDITALDREGDLPAYMRDLIRPTRNQSPATKRRDRRRWGAVPIPPDHKPGQWPPGTSPPGPSPERDLPPEAWAAAARHHSNERNRPDQPCDCGNCPLNGKEATTWDAPAGSPTAPERPAPAAATATATSAADASTATSTSPNGAPPTTTTSRRSSATSGRHKG